MKSRSSRAERRDSSDDESLGMLGQPLTRTVSITYIAGIIKLVEIQSFKRLLFRTTKGKVLVKICDKEATIGESCVFILIFQDL